MDNKEALLEQLRDEISKAAGKGLEFDLSPYLARLEPGELEKLERFLNFEKLSHEAWEAGRKGGSFTPPSAGDEWSNEELEILKLMNLGGKAASRDLFRPFDDLKGYVPEDRIGSGAAGTVFKCGISTLPGSRRALKILKPGAFSRTRFRLEAKLMERIKSPYVVDIQNVIPGSGDNLCLVMEYVDGGSLREIIKSRKQTSEPEVLKWMSQCCQGMQRVTEDGIVHRDLKPSNLLIDSRSRDLKICDFGLARELLTENLLTDDPEGNPDAEAGATGTHSASMTLTNQMLGTPLYVSPEQATNAKTVDERSDIYSFGATFYHLLTGQPPFVAPTILETIRMHKEKSPVPASSLKPEISPGLNAILDRCLKKEPARRFQSFKEILDQLEQLQRPVRELKPSLISRLVALLTIRRVDLDKLWETMVPLIGCPLAIAGTYLQILGLISAAKDGWGTFWFAFMVIPYGIYRGIISLF